MQVTEQDPPISGHADMTGRWHLLVLLLFAVALGHYQSGGAPMSDLMIRDELRLSFEDLSSLIASFNIASAAGFLLMAVFIWREKSCLGYCAMTTPAPIPE